MKDDYIYLCSVSGQLAGDMIRILLESMNIPVITSQESAGITYGLTVGPLGEVKVYVPENNYLEAKNIILAVEKGELRESIYPGQYTSSPEYKNNKLSASERIKDL